MMQFCNVLVCSAGMLTAVMSTSLWTAAGWRPWQIGLAVTVANGCYALLTGYAGRLAERYGRARICMIGGVIGALGNSIAWLYPHPLSALAATMIGFAGSAIYFPGAAGLMSEVDGPDLTLHRKLSIYNIGWAMGALTGFAGLGLLQSLPVVTGYAISVGDFALVAILVFHWRNLQVTTVAPSGDRSDHPALARLTVMGRVSLLIGAALGMGVMAVLQRCLSYSLPKEAQSYTSLTLTCYAAAYVVLFLVLGRWSGWILRPWRIWMISSSALAGGFALLLFEHFGLINQLSLILCGLLFGLSFGAVYMISIYYSMRLPHGVSRAAGLHETFVGLGNTLGPVVAGLTVDGIMALSGSSVSAVTALAIFVILFALINLGWQASMIPGATRLGAK
jgi:MFS family permease